MLQKRQINSAGESSKWWSGFGYVILPKNIDRNGFIQYCFNTGTVLIISNDGEQFTDIKISKNLLNYLEFPEDENGLGSMIVFSRMPHSKTPIITGLISKGDDLPDWKEHQFKVGKNHKNKGVQISGDASKGILNVSVTNGSELNLSITGSGSKINVRGENLNITSNKMIATIRDSFSIKLKKVGEEGETSLSYTLGEGFSYEDEFQNILRIKNNEIEIQGEKFNISNKNSYSVKNLLDDIVEQISLITVQTALGQMPIMNKVQVEQLKTKIAQIFN